MARAVTAPLGNNPANNGLRELLKTAQIAQKRDRVVVTATLTPSVLNRIAASANRTNRSSPIPVPDSGFLIRLSIAYSLTSPASSTPRELRDTIPFPAKIKPNHCKSRLMSQLRHSTRSV